MAKPKALETFRAGIDLIRVPRRENDPVQPDKVAAIAESIKKIGLRTPISIRKKPKGDFIYEIVAGRHRLAAMEKLGETKIEVRLEKGSDVDAEMWEVSENLHRTNMGTKAQADATVRWEKLAAEKAKEQPEVLSPAGTKGGRPKKAGSIRATAKAFGIGKSEVERRRKIAKVSDEATAILESEGMNAPIDYLAIADVPKAEQAKAAREYVKTRKAYLAEQAAEKAKPKAARVSALAKAWASASDADREAFVVRDATAISATAKACAAAAADYPDDKPVTEEMVAAATAAAEAWTATAKRLRARLPERAA